MSKQIENIQRPGHFSSLFVQFLTNLLCALRDIQIGTQLISIKSLHFTPVWSLAFGIACQQNLSVSQVSGVADSGPRRANMQQATA